MAVKTVVMRKLKDFCFYLKNEKILDIKLAYLFGSAVLGKNNRFSDIDLAIVSDSFTGFRYADRAMLNPYVIKVDSSIEVHPFTSKEFKNKVPFSFRDA